MRGVLLASVIVVAVLATVPGWSPLSALGLSGPGVPGGGGLPGPTVRASEPGAPAHWAGVPQWLNATLAPSALSSPSAGPVPTSALAETPPPWVPATTPVVMQFLSSSRTCCVETNFTSPAGPWATILLNFTAQVVAGVYDSSYRAYIDGAEVMFGTSPEYGTWTVLQNLSQYRTLFNGTTNLTFLFGEAVTTGYFLTSVSLEFYPLPSGARPAPAPDLVVPLWHLQAVRSTTPTIFTNATVPANATAVVLELFVYGFGPDEFWWSTAPPMRAAQFGTGTTTLGAVFPFPYINTGGIDLFLWRPITADFTTSDRPYQMNLSGDLGAISGPHEYWANMTGWTPGSTWLIGGSLLVWTDPSIVSATQNVVRYSGISVSGAGATEAARVSFGGFCTLTNRTGSLATVGSSVDEWFNASGATAPGWQNLTQSTTFNESTSIVDANGTTTDHRAWTFPLSVDLGQQIVITSTTNGSYPETANFTTYMLNVAQEWNAQRSLSRAAGGVTSLIDRQAVDDQLGGANGIFGGTETLSGPNAALVTAITLIESSTSKQYTEVDGPPSGASVYSHLLIGSSYQPPGPYSAETVTTDATRSVPFPLIAAVSLPAPTLDLGQPLSVLAQVRGGFGPYTLSWSGLPRGCSGGNSVLVTCIPAAAGSFAIVVRVTDSAGDTALPALGTVYIAPTPNATLIANRTAFDVGQTVYLTAAVSGGVAPFVCTWYLAGAAQGAPVDCATPFTFPAQSTGPIVTGAWIQDGTGAQFWATNLTVTVGPPLSVGVTAGASVSAVPLGQGVVLSAQPAGGVGPYTWTWSIDGTPIAGSGGSQYTFVPNATGSFGLAVTVTDATGSHATSSAIVVRVVPSTSPGTSPSASASGVPQLWFFAVVGATIAELFVILVLAARRARPPARPPPPRPYGPAPPRVGPSTGPAPPPPPPPRPPWVE